MFTDCMLCISTISKVKTFLVLQLLIAERQENKSEYIMNLLSTEEATNFQARSIVFVSARSIELADGNKIPKES
jgi:hypothetical protein